MRACNFCINGKLIENVIHYSHLGHIINSNFTDVDDILHIRISFVGQNLTYLVLTCRKTPINQLLVKLTICSAFF